MKQLFIMKWNQCESNKSIFYYKVKFETTVNVLDYDGLYNLVHYQL